jgi:6-phosphogluconolactonase
MRRAIVGLFFALVACGSNGSDATTSDSSTDGTIDSTIVDSGHDVASETHVPDVCGCDGSDAATTTPIAYVATGDGKISTFDMDASTGELTPKSSFDAGNYPSFLAIDRTHLRLYAVLEASDLVAAFAIAKGTGALGLLGTVPSPGEPTHLSLDRDDAHLMVANYSAGTTIIFSLAADGSIGAATDRHSPGKNTHQMLVDPTDAFVFVPNKGSDIVAQFHYDATAGTLAANTPPTLATATGAGPRHLAFHPDGAHAYLIDELDSTMSALDFDAAKGTLSITQTITTLPSGFSGTNTAAEVQVSPSGAFVYGSNRGADDIVVFSVDAATKKLTLVAHTPTTGKTPRHFSLDDSGAFLFVANQDSNDVVSFRVDAAKGTLTEVASTPVSAAPYWVGVVPVPSK